MIRGYQVTLPLSTTKYNLWNDLITKDPTFSDPTFSGRDAFGNSIPSGTGFYVPKIVCDLKIRLPFNQVPDQGNSLSIQDALTGNEKNNIVTGETHQESALRNAIDLTKILLQPSANGMVADVQITSL